MKKKRKKKKSEALKLIEFSAAYTIIFFIRIIPFGITRLFSNVLGDILFFLVAKRRRIAIENLRHAYSGEKTEREIEKLARDSCRSFFLTFMEIVKYRYLFSGPDAVKNLKSYAANLDELFMKAKKAHDNAKGCIFVTPHLGNWELLPHVSSLLGIPLAIVARPLDNEYLEKLIFRSRSAKGQFIVPKKNALFVLQKTLQKGTSIGMLPDQSTAKGVMVDFFGRPATATPIPAILAITYNRPIVVVAACRKGNRQYEGFVSDPIRPGKYTSEKAEIIRITEEVTRNMESIIRKYPEQYLWMHNRWKTYKGKKAIMS